MDKNKHITDEEWSAIARDLYEGESVQLSEDQKSGEGKAEVEKTALEIDLYFRLKKFDPETAFRDLKKRLQAPEPSNRMQAEEITDIQDGQPHAADPRGQSPAPKAESQNQMQQSGPQDQQLQSLSPRLQIHTHQPQIRDQNLESTQQPESGSKQSQNQVQTGRLQSPVYSKKQGKAGKTIAFLKKKSILKIAAAAVFALIIAGIGFLAGNRQNTAHQPAAVIVDQYGNSRIKLADGSVVTLNHDSKINYPDKFRDDSRVVSIEGEAFFEVRPDPSRPFVIHAGKAIIKVLGTSFNVNAYPQNENVEVVVEEGTVQVTKSGDTKGVSGGMILDPGDRGLLSGFSGEMKKARNDNPNFLSWKTREFVFDKTSLKEVMIQLNKVYQTEVKAKDPQLENLLLSARFEDRSLDFILKVISMTHDLKVEQKDNQYILKRNF